MLGMCNREAIADYIVVTLCSCCLSYKVCIL